MSVSYMSQQPFQSSAPIPSLDLNLMASVLQQKQGQFDANFTKAQTQLSTVASLDMIREEDRKYRDAKLNELTNNLNNINGDYSDPNISSQIDNSVSSIFTDSRILNSVASTKNIRALQSSYQALQANPKMAKYFSEANFDADMEEVNRYASSKDPNDSYRGKSSATPFASYMPDLTKAAEKIKADGWSKLTNGVDGYYNINTGETVSSEKISQNIMSLLDSNQKGQLARDANYLWGKKLNLSPDELIGKINGSTSAKLSTIDESLKNLQFLRTKTTDPKDIQKIDDQIAQFTQDKTALSARKLDTEKQYTDYLKGGGSLEGLRYMAYQDDLAKTLGRMYSYNKTKLDTKVDLYSLEKVKALQREREMGLAYHYKSKLQEEAASYKNNAAGGTNAPAPPPINMPDNTSGANLEPKDLIKFHNQQASKYENYVFDNQKNRPEIKLYKDNLTAAAEGKPAILPLNADNDVFVNDVFSFGALRNRIAASSATGQGAWKEQDAFAVEENKANKPSIDKYKMMIANINPSFGPSENIRIKSVGMSRRQFIKDKDGNLNPDNNFYADIEVKKGNKYVPVPAQRIPDDFVEAITGGKVKRQDPIAEIVNSGVDIDNHFSTVVQSKTNPKAAFKITTAKEPNGLYETYVEINGQAIPISKMFASDGARQTKLPYESLQTARAILNNINSVEQLKSFVKNYTPDASDNTSKIKFNNNTAYDNFGQTVKEFGAGLQKAMEQNNKYGDRPIKQNFKLSFLNK